jgi:pimeloyl-ACP methyl ester carboxylesterase
VWTIDFRGHGSSGKAPDGRYDDWTRFVDDLFAVLEALGLAGWRGVGHSLGGAILLLAEQRTPGTFGRLCLYEPVVIPPAIRSEGFGGPISMSDLARKRRQSFPSFRAARDNFVAKPPMNSFDPAALDAYVTYGFVEDPTGGVTLACAPDDEASVYEGAPESHAWDHLDQVRVPVAVLAGVDPRDPVSRVVEEVARQLPGGVATRLTGLSHFGPFEDPGGVGRVAAEALGADPGSPGCGQPPIVLAPPP